MPHQLTPERTSSKVAVIGAGAAGLVAARELRREGHHVTVFERSNKVGGIWVYDPATESDPLGIDPLRTTVHTSLYASLRTNLPREIMGFRDYPFIAKHEKDRDPRRFPCHQEVLCYLEDFMTEFGLHELIRFETEVVHVGWIEEKKWVVRSKRKDREAEEGVFNAVVVCVGHNSKPNVADIPGVDVWPGEEIHSHNYRVPDPYKNKVVVLIGGASSAYDISREIAGVAKEVHVVSRSNTNKNPTKQLGYDNFWHHSMIKSSHEDSTVVFGDGSSILVDIILHCTGYKYDYPFLNSDDIVTVDDNCVGLLYQHIFPPLVAPWISFIGIPWKIAPFPFFEIQSKWVAGILSERISLPSQAEMISDVESFYAKLKSDGVPKRYTHEMSYSQTEYMDWLAAHCQYPPLEEWRKQMFLSLNMSRESKEGISENYRDEWGDQDLFMQAHKDFLQYISPSKSSAHECHDPSAV